MDPEALYMQLGQLVADMPKLDGNEPLGPEVAPWLGRAAVLVEAGNNTGDSISFRSACDHLGPLREMNAHMITSIIHRALARAEAKAPAAAQGAFVPVGAEFSILQAISKIVGDAKAEVLFVDPYLDHTALTSFAALVPVGIPIRLLSDGEYVKWIASLGPAIHKWSKEYGVKRPAAARVSLPRALHDRLLIVDGSDVWSLSQSLKDFATRSPGTILRVPPEIAAFKIDAYEALWASGTPL